MALFDEREREFEARFKHDQELQFKVKARRNRLIGLWAADEMGLTGEAASAYAKSIVEAAFDGGDKNIVEKLVADLAAKGVSRTEAQINFELNHFAEAAKKQQMKE